jgi:hypothetical protein
MRLTRKIGGCDDSTCPAVWETSDPGTLAVRGTHLTDPAALADAGETPAHETVVLIPRSMLEDIEGGS